MEPWSDAGRRTTARRDQLKPQFPVGAPKGRDHLVAWDTYDGGSYNIRLRSVVDGRAGESLQVTNSPRFHAHPTVAVDAHDRLWIAYDEADENWGKDGGFLLSGGTGIYNSRTIALPFTMARNGWSRLTT